MRWDDKTQLQYGTSPTLEVWEWDLYIKPWTLQL